MRISETLSLTSRSINTETWNVTIGSDIFGTKSKNKQVLPIRDVRVLREIAARLIRACTLDSERLFQHTDQGKTTKTVKRYVKLFLPGREDINVHSLRHTCWELLHKAVPIYTVQRWMRHSTIRSAQKYADLLAKDISRAVGGLITN